MEKKKTTTKKASKATKAAKSSKASTATTAKKTKSKATTPSRARPSGRKRVALSYDAPNAGAVAVTGSFCGWDDGVPLKKDRSGRWKTTLTLPKGDHEYRFVVDGEWRDDPNCSDRIPNRFGSENCVLHV